MKRVGNIYPKICNKNNIRSAITHAAKGKTNRENVKRVIENIDYYVDEIYSLLMNKSFRASSYEKKEIVDGVKNKKRIIYKPRFFPTKLFIGV